MAAPDDNEESLSFEALFLEYANFIEDPKELDNVEYEEILLSQADNWMKKAGIIKRYWDTTDSGMSYLKLKKWRMNFEDFLEFLQELCNQHDVDIEVIKNLMVEAGPPSKSEPAAITK